MTITTRLGAATPLSAGLTLGTIWVMASLIATEYSVPEKGPRFDIGAINPVEQIIELPPEIRLPKPDKVEVPPAPPVLPTTVAGKPTNPIAPDAKLPVLPKRIAPIIETEIRLNGGDMSPIVRIPPAMPVRAERSGYCTLSLNISAEGSPYDVVANDCSESLFRRSAVKAVLQWKYNPQYRDGNAVPYLGHTETIRFNLLDENGQRIPERP